MGEKKKNRIDKIDTALEKFLKKHLNALKKLAKK